jgi:hypothetical protein
MYVLSSYSLFYLYNGQTKQDEMSGTHSNAWALEEYMNLLLDRPEMETCV